MMIVEKNDVLKGTHLKFKMQKSNENFDFFFHFLKTSFKHV